MECVLSQARSRVAGMAKRPDKFLEEQPDIFQAAKVVAKVVYDCAKANEADEGGLDTLPELVIEGFDEEQVWAGVEMQNGARMDDMGGMVDRLARSVALGGAGDLLLGDRRGKRRPTQADEAQPASAKKRKVQFTPEEEEEEEFDEDEDVDDLGEEEEEEMEGEGESEEGEGEEEGSEEGDPILDDPDFQNMSDSDGDDLPLFENAKSDEDEDDEDGDEAEEARVSRKEALEEKTSSYLDDAMKNLRKNVKQSEVEDRFFKLSEMEKFLEKEDAAEERKRLREEKGLDDEDDDEDDLDQIDYFDAGEDSGDEDEERAKYKDYFQGGQEEAKEDIKDEEGEGEEEEESPDESEERPDSASAQGPNRLFDDSDEEGRDLGEVKSSFEEAQLRLKKKIAKLEDEAVADKPWQMKGEVAGPARPENSLLQEHLEYDNVAKQAPVITEEVSRRLEDIILQRVKDKAWDDVERKVKPREDPYEYKKRLVLDQEKSKSSLAEIYEQEYLQQKSQAEEQTKVQGLLTDDKDDGAPSKEVEDIKKGMRTLFSKLDALTHYHYAPKGVDPEVRVIKNLPSIAMEEVAPAARSDASLMAPQELQPSSRADPIGQSERTDTDRKRERRKKKAKQRAIRVHKEKKEGGLPSSKKSAEKELEQAEKKGKLERLKDKGKDKAVKSSSAFFSQLQQESAQHVKAKAAAAKPGGKKDKGQRQTTGATFKL